MGDSRAPRRHGDLLAGDTFVWCGYTLRVEAGGIALGMPIRELTLHVSEVAVQELDSRYCVYRCESCEEFLCADDLIREGIYKNCHERAGEPCGPVSSPFGAELPKWFP